jgi:hypothetical protein
MMRVTAMGMRKDIIRPLIFDPPWCEVTGRIKNTAVAIVMDEAKA